MPGQASISPRWAASGSYAYLAARNGAFVAGATQRRWSFRSSHATDNAVAVPNTPSLGWGETPPPTAPTLRVRDLLEPARVGTAATVTAWVRTARHQKTYSFLELNDGSCAGSLQVVWRNDGTVSPAERAALGTGSSVRVAGALVASPKPGQAVELVADTVTLVGGCDAAVYPLQKKV